jgi:hypothetical protein
MGKYEKIGSPVTRHKNFTDSRNALAMLAGKDYGPQSGLALIYDHIRCQPMQRDRDLTLESAKMWYSLLCLLGQQGPLASLDFMALF